MDKLKNEKYIRLKFKIAMIKKHDVFVVVDDVQIFATLITRC